MATTLGLSDEDVLSSDFLNTFSGTSIYPNTQPCLVMLDINLVIGQLGDGALNLTEVVHEDKTYTLQLKGAGPTPYSRTADGLVLRSSIREYLCAEAMHYLGVPTTRSLSLMLSAILCCAMYNGNPAYEKGAIVCVEWRHRLFVLEVSKYWLRKMILLISNYLLILHLSSYYK
jgi:uncharacterized protein YdiU (UPF0061 family)